MLLSHLSLPSEAVALGAGLCTAPQHPHVPSSALWVAFDRDQHTMCGLGAGKLCSPGCSSGAQPQEHKLGHPRAPPSLCLAGSHSSPRQSWCTVARRGRAREISLHIHSQGCFGGLPG